MLAVNAIVAANVQVPSSGAAAIIADFTEHAIRVAYIARRDAVRLPDAEWRVPGIYVLITDDGSHGVYVGKSNDLRSRVMQHKTNNVHVPTWARAMLVKRDTSNGFSSAEVGYLEGRLSAELDAISGITVVKGKTNGDATLPPHMQASLDALLSSILAAVRLAGVDTLRNDEDEHGPPGVTRTQTSGTVADLLAEGLLHAGAELHCKRSGKPGIGTLSSDGQIIVAGVGYKSPSLAAGISLGATSSTGYGGWEMWHVGSLDGPNLAELRAQLATPDDS